MYFWCIIIFFIQEYTRHIYSVHSSCILRFIWRPWKEKSEKVINILKHLTSSSLSYYWKKIESPIIVVDHATHAKCTDLNMRWKIMRIICEALNKILKINLVIKKYMYRWMKNNRKSNNMINLKPIHSYIYIIYIYIVFLWV